MLMLFSSFYTRFTARSALYLINPRIFEAQQISYPKKLIVHYLDESLDDLFVSRNLIYFKDLPANKKVIVYHMEDLASKDGVRSLHNKTLPRDIRRWNRDNLKSFRYINLMENSVTDENTVSVINYNTLIGLYNYSTSLLSKHFQFYNLHYTYWTTVKKSLTLNPDYHALVSIELPSTIPSFFIIDKLISFNTIKYNRLVTDVRLKQIIELYKWLSNKTRADSVMKDLDDLDSQRVVIEFKYKNYVSLVPLSILRSLHDESEIDSKIKLNTSKFNRIVISVLLRMQKNINSLIESEEKYLEENALDKTETNSTLMVDPYDDEPMDDVDRQNVNSDDYTDHSEVRNLPNDQVSGLDKRLSNVDTDLNAGFDTLSTDLAKLEEESEMNHEVDNIFSEDILNASDSEETETQTSQPETAVQFPSIEAAQASTVNKTNEEKFNDYIKTVKTLKIATSNEIRSLSNLFENRKQLKSPYNPEQLFNEDTTVPEAAKKLTPDIKEIKTNNPIVQANLHRDTLTPFDSNYVQDVLPKDVLSSVMKLEDSDLIIKNYEVTTNESPLGKYEVHKLTLKPYSGKESTIYFRLPKIDKDGRFYASGIKYIMRKQKTDVPIRKIDSYRVALTSNYCKLFINRTERKAFDYFNYIQNFIKEEYLNEEGVITKVQPGRNFDNYSNLPAVYNYLTKYFTLVETKEYVFEFNPDAAAKHVGPKVLEDLIELSMTYIGYRRKDKVILVMDVKNNIYAYVNKDSVEPLGQIEDLLHIEKSKLPVSFTNIKVLGKDIPLGVVLGYYLGLSNMVSLLNIKYKFIESNKRYELENNEYQIRFNDFKLILNRDDAEAAQLLSGFLFFKDYIKQYQFNDFNEKNVYLGLIESRDFNMLHLKELDLLRDLFLDPITVDVLKDINEPFEYIPLLLRANQLLVNFDHPDMNDPDYVRIRGYDRVPGLMYRALVESVRNFKFKYNSRSKIELDPYKVWNYVTQDNTVKITEDVNPLMDLKEVENVTLTGMDGLSRDAIPENMRKFHKNDIGLFSEATVDSADVAVNSYMTPFAKLDNVRGTIDKNLETYKQDPVNYLSTSALLAPFVTHDD